MPRSRRARGGARCEGDLPRWIITVMAEKQSGLNEGGEGGGNVIGRLAQAIAVRPRSLSATRAGIFSFITSPGRISVLPQPERVSSRMGQKGAVQLHGDPPRPPGELDGEGADAGADLQHAAGGIGAGGVGNIIGHPGLNEKILPHALGKAEAVPP